MSKLPLVFRPEAGLQHGWGARGGPSGGGSVKGGFGSSETCDGWVDQAEGDLTSDNNYCTLLNRLKLYPAQRLFTPQIKTKLTIIIHDCCCHGVCSKHDWWTGWLNGHSEVMVTFHIHVIHCRYHGSHNSAVTRSQIKRHSEWTTRTIVNLCNDRESELGMDLDAIK